MIRRPLGSLLVLARLHCRLSRLSGHDGLDYTGGPGTKRRLEKDRILRAAMHIRQIEAVEELRRYGQLGSNRS